MSRFTVLLILIGIIAVSVISGGAVPGELKEINGKYSMQDGTSLPSLIVSLLMMPFIFVFKPKGKPKTSASPVRLSVRFLAFLIDFTTALAIISPIVSLPILLVEWHASGDFSWYFRRDVSRAADNVLMLTAVFTSMAWMLIYLSFPLIKGRPTIGQYIMGYQISNFRQSKSTFARAVLRNVYGFLVLCVWPITLLMAVYHPKKYMFHDNENGFRPEKTTYER